MLTNIIAASRLRQKPFIAKVFIGGVDATKYADAQGFSDFFRENFDPTNPVVVPVSDILSYETEPDGNGRLNIEIEIQGQKTIPSIVFSNYLSSESGSRIRYFIDNQQIFTSLSGNRNFATNPLEFILLRDLTDISLQWNGFAISGIVPRVLDFESLQNLSNFYFHNYLNGNDRINIRNATNFLEDPSSDSVFFNYNLNGNDNAKKVIYVHHSMATINNGSPFNSLQLAINRGADVRYVSDTTTIPQEPTNITIQELGATYVILDFPDVAAADFYDVFKDNFENPVEQFFPIQEITNSDKLIFNLTPNTFYRFRLKTFDVNFNQSPKSNSISFTTAALNPLFQNAVAYYKLDETSGQAIDFVNGYNGTLFGGVTQGVAGKIGNAYSFDGSSGYVDLGDNDDFSFTDGTNDLPFTISCWVKWNSFPSGSTFNGTWLVSKRAGGPTDREWQLIWLNGDLAIQTFEPDNTQGNDSLVARFNNANLNTGQWYHVVGTYDGSGTKEGLTIYLNGIDVTNERTGDNSLYTGMANTNAPVVLGYEGGWNDFYLDGEMDEVTIIKNEEWTAGKVSDNYNNGNGTTI